MLTDRQERWLQRTIGGYDWISLCCMGVHGIGTLDARGLGVVIESWAFVPCSYAVKSFGKTPHNGRQYVGAYPSKTDENWMNGGITQSEAPEHSLIPAPLISLTTASGGMAGIVPKKVANEAQRCAALTSLLSRRGFSPM